MGKITNAIKAMKQSARFRISLPFFSYEMNLKELVDSTNIDDRIAKLGEIKADLEAAVIAVDSLKSEAEDRKAETNNLRETIEQLNEERNTAEALLKLPEESFARLLTKANSKGHLRGIIEGSLIGFSTGTISSIIVWYFTN